METNRRAIIKGASVAGTIAVTGGSATLLSACGEDESEAAPANASIPTAEVPVGSGAVVDESYVVTQPKKGQFYAFSSVCTHQGCQVRTVTETEIVCPCHSSQFSTTTGEVLVGPATEPLPAFSVQEEGGTLKVSAK